MNLTQEELDKLENCKSREDWNSVCGEVKAARDGAYPPDWYAKVMLTGMAKRITAKWGSDAKILVHTRVYIP